VFLRLFEELVDELTLAVDRRLAQGRTKTEIAHQGGIAPAVLSRVLSGRSGTNLRTVAAVLTGTDHRLKVMAIPCEHLMDAKKVWSCPSLEREDYYHFVFSDGMWHEGIDSPTPEVSLITASGDEVRAI